MADLRPRVTPSNSRPVDSRAYAQEWLAKQSVGSLYSPASDPLSAGYTQAHNFGVGATIGHGRIVDAWPYQNAYRVLFERGLPTRICTALTTSSLSAVGPRFQPGYRPGDRVCAVIHPSLSYGLILGVEPNYMTDPTLARSDFIHQSSRCGLRVDSAHSSIAKFPRSGGVYDWSSGRPFDTTTAGDWGAITETGLRIFLDSFMAQIGADEATGLFVFYHDQLLRLAAANFEQFTAGSTAEWLNDDGEILGYHGWTPYPWENLGAVESGGGVTRSYSPEESQIIKPHYSALEPLKDDQAPIHRVMDFRGYLGQAGKHLVVAPATNVTVNSYGEPLHVAGLAETHHTLSGRIIQRSALEISSIKTISIPAPVRLHQAQNPAGDTTKNYNAAGTLGEADRKHKLTGNIARTDPSASQSAAGALDSFAYACNWEGVHPFHYHTKDWQVPEDGEGELGHLQPVNFGSLASVSELPPPTEVPFRIDSRHSANYYPSISYVRQLEDGTVLIGCGWGSEIRMTGGNIYLDAPGSVFVRSGRDFVALAGHDAVVRAKNSADLTVTDGDVRLKAARNYQVRAGTEEQAGGMLFEQVGPPLFEYGDRVGEDVRSGGITFKSKSGGIYTAVREIYLRTGGGDVDTGGITLDAARGQAAVTTHASSAIRFIRGTAADHFGQAGDIISTNLWSPTTSLLGGSLSIDGITEIGNSLLVNGYIEVVGGHIATELSAEKQGLVDTLDRRAVDILKRGFTAAKEAEATAVAGGSSYFQELFTDYLYKTGFIGDDATIRAVGFSFRNDDQYKTSSLEIWEARWQQLARLTGQAASGWTEKPIQAGSTMTMPWPGFETWANRSALVEQDLQLYDPSRGVAQSRSSDAYEEPSYKTPTKKTADGSYLIIV